MMFLPLFLRALAGLMLACALCLAAGSAPAAEHAAEHAAEYTVCVEDLDFYPIYRTRDGVYEGFARELLDAFARKQGLRFKYRPLPVRRLFRDFYEFGVCDFKFPDNPTWQVGIKSRAKPVYSKPVVDVLEGLMALPSNRDRPLDEIRRLGTIQGFSPWPYAKQIDSGHMQLTQTNSTESLVRMAMLGRVDAIFHAVPVVEESLDHALHQPGALVFMAALPSYRAEFSLATLKHAEVVNALNGFLASSHKALLDQLRKRYGL